MSEEKKIRVFCEECGKELKIEVDAENKKERQVFVLPCSPCIKYYVEKNDKRKLT